MGLASGSACPFSIQRHRRVHEQALVSREPERGVRADDDDEVEARRKCVLFQPERFAQQAFEPVASNGVSDASADGQPESSVAQIISLSKQNERASGFADLGVIDRLELGGVREALVAAKGEAGCRRVVRSRRGHEQMISERLGADPKEKRRGSA